MDNLEWTIQNGQSRETVNRWVQDTERKQRKHKHNTETKTMRALTSPKHQVLTKGYVIPVSLQDIRRVTDIVKSSKSLVGDIGKTKSKHSLPFEKCKFLH